MNLNSYFESIDIAEINRYVIDKQEENIHLEFKTVNFPNHTDKNRIYDLKNLSKVISGFANSNGGIIVWGIKAKSNKNNQDVAFEKCPIKELTRFINFLNRNEGQAVTPIVEGIVHKKIEENDDEGYIVTYVPESLFAPHMANFSEKYYYKRSGDSFYICEHYDIRDMFQRKTSANLDILLCQQPTKKIGNKIRLEILISLINNGSYLAKAPLVRIDINSPFQFSEYGVDGNGFIGLFDKRSTPSHNQKSTYLGGQDTIVYPGITYGIDKLRIEIAENCKDIPDLIVNYMIIAENFEKIEKVKELKINCP